MKYNLILDTNVLVSALLDKDKTSAPNTVMHMIFDKKASLYYSELIIEEYKGVLSRPEFLFSKGNVGSLINFIKKIGILVTPKSISEILKDKKDMPFYELVMSTRNENSKLITGNKKHFPDKTFIMTPREFLDDIV